MNEQQTAQADRARFSAGSSSMRTAINRIAAAMSGPLSAGDLAELRRLEPDDPSAPAFWKVMAAYIRPAVRLPDGEDALERAEQRWAAILNAMAVLENLHHPGRRLGEALATAGYSELRFARLLRARDSGVLYAVRRTAMFLRSKGEPVDCSDLADLILSDGRAFGERVRRRIARSYYGTVR